MALNTLGSNRDQLIDLAIAERERLINQAVLVGDPRRWRPRWFDGRFLSASDLQGEQNYFLIRQADLGRASGSGVIDGLMVSEAVEQGTGIQRLRIEAGQGVTDTGELVVLFDPLTLNPADVPEIQRLDAAFGLQVIPNEPGRTRTGLYIVALRPVEWTANPIGAYPTSLTGARKVEDSTIVEGVAVSLIPYPDQSSDEAWNRRRARVAREIFVDGRNQGLTSGVLPLAMVALRGNLVEWVDPFLVRRETGAERPAGMDFGFGARSLREAHLLQYQRHLADAMNANNDQAFLATSYLDALPPVGQFPSAALDADRLTQRFFPPAIDVELSFIPEDELTAVIEESLLVPPIDLTAGLDQLSGTGVVVLIPMTRSEFAANRSVLPNWDAESAATAPGLHRDQGAGHATGPSALAVVLSGCRCPRRPPKRSRGGNCCATHLAGGCSGMSGAATCQSRPTSPGRQSTPIAPSSRIPERLIELMGTDAPLAERIGRLRTIDAPELNGLDTSFDRTTFRGQPRAAAKHRGHGRPAREGPAPTAADCRVRAGRNDRSGAREGHGVARGEKRNARAHAEFRSSCRIRRAARRGPARTRRTGGAPPGTRDRVADRREGRARTSR